MGLRALQVWCGAHWEELAACGLAHPLGPSNHSHLQSFAQQVPSHRGVTGNMLQMGAALWDAAHGIDARRVEPPKDRKSVGAEVNWGIRFQSPQEAQTFLDGLAGPDP